MRIDYAVSHLLTTLPKVIDIQEKKKKLIGEVSTAACPYFKFIFICCQAFSGIKSKQTQRNKREARAQGLSFLVRHGTCSLRLVELIALFGSRDRDQSQQSNPGQTTLDTWTSGSS